MFPNALLVSLLHVFLFSTSQVRAQGQLTAAEDIATQYSLTTSTSIPFPSATLSSTDATNFIQDPSNDWSLSKGKIQNLANDTEFVSDPFPNSPTPGLAPIQTNSTVLQVTYPTGSLHSTGGTQMYSLWNTTDGSMFNSMLLSYELAFDEEFDWVKGGKLPGLRGGPNPDGCSGGNEPNGSDCFSTRMMWRTDGQGEVYAYIPTPNHFCNDNGIICNDDFGVSIGRGAFTFVPGQWNRITMLVQMNSPQDVANGNLKLYYNDVLAISQENMQYRSALSVSAGGFYMSTFFGGNDLSWAPTNTTHAFFRNVRLWGSSAASNLTGSTVSAAPSTHEIAWLVGIICLALSIGVVGF